MRTHKCNDVLLFWFCFNTWRWVLWCIWNVHKTIWSNPDYDTVNSLMNIDASTKIYNKAYTVVSCNIILSTPIKLQQRTNLQVIHNTYLGNSTVTTPFGWISTLFPQNLSLGWIEPWKIKCSLSAWKAETGGWWLTCSQTTLFK